MNIENCVVCGKPMQTDCEKQLYTQHNVCSANCKLTLEKKKFHEFNHDKRIEQLKSYLTVKSVRMCYNADPGYDEYHPNLFVEYWNGEKCYEFMNAPLDDEQFNLYKMATEFYRSKGFKVKFMNWRKTENFVQVERNYNNDFGVWSRPTFQSIYMQTACSFRDRSTCIRRQVGAVFVNDEFTRVISVGYNGGISGAKNQCDTTIPGACGCIHAEVNAIMKAQEPLKNSILFVTLSPCQNCAKLLAMKKVGTVYYLSQYRDTAGIDILRSNGVNVVDWQSYAMHEFEQNLNAQY